MAILRRKLTGRGVCIPDRGHLHHRLAERGIGPRKSLLLVGSLCAVTTAGALGSMVLRAEWIAPVVALGVTAFLAVTRLFGHSEFALLARRTRAFLQSSYPFQQQSGAVQEHRSRLQGTREWDHLWESLVTFADRCRLDSVQLSVSLPLMHEEFFAGWDRRSPPEAGRVYRADIPLASPVFGTIGSLRIAGRCPENSACTWISELIEGLRPFETQIADLLASESVARPLPPPSRPRVPVSGLRHRPALVPAASAFAVFPSGGSEDPSGPAAL
jgi:UDP-GlcNAc:undecaprenyl-phosphate GlcNAc-1-phosphate transferase